MAPHKLLLQLAVRGGSDRRLDERLRDEARRFARRLPRGESGVRILRRLPDDPFGTFNPGMRGFEATLDLRCGAAAPLLAAVSGLGERIADLVHVDLSAALLGVDHEIVPPPHPTPVRYQYLMRRRQDLTHAQYIEHYLHVHAEFGRRTPGIEGYVQLHIEPEPSREAAARAGFGLWSVDSVSELHLETAEKFTKALASWPGGADAIRDEENFVDRANSVMFTCEELAV